MSAPHEIAAAVEAVRQSLYAVLAAFDLNDPDICAGDALTHLEAAVATCATARESLAVVRSHLSGALPHARALVATTAVLWDTVSADETTVCFFPLLVYQSPPTTRSLIARLEAVRRALYATLGAFDFNESDASAWDSLTDLQRLVEDMPVAAAKEELRKCLVGPNRASQKLLWRLLALLNTAAEPDAEPDVVVVAMPTRRSLQRRRRDLLLRRRRHGLK